MILIIGQSGQVARALKQLNPKGVRCLAREECDLSQPELLEQKLGPLLSSKKFKTVINAAAYTQVDLAEKERNLCLAANTTSPIAIAKLCASYKIPFIHYSSDYVYGSQSTDLLTEASPCAPVNFYGDCKLRADRGILALKSRAFILRTSWVYDAEGKNFVTSMLNLFKSREELKVVADQVGAPTFAGDIAQMTFDLLPMLEKATGPEVIHLTNDGRISWFEFAALILSAAKNKGMPVVTQSLLPIDTSEWPTPAKRQLNSRLSLEKLKSKYGITPRPVEAALNDCLTEALK